MTCDVLHSIFCVSFIIDRRSMSAAQQCHAFCIIVEACHHRIILAGMHNCWYYVFLQIVEKVVTPLWLSTCSWILRSGIFDNSFNLRRIPHLNCSQLSSSLVPCPCKWNPLCLACAVFTDICVVWLGRGVYLIVRLFAFSFHINYMNHLCHLYFSCYLELLFL